MPSLTIRGIPDDLLETLRRRAQQHRRSLNSEVLNLLERSAGSSPIDPGAALARIRHLRETNDLPYLTDGLLDRAIEEGRP